MTDKKCRLCGRYVPTLSKRSQLCNTCSSLKVKTTIEEIRARKGKTYTKWLKNIILGIEGYKKKVKVP